MIEQNLLNKTALVADDHELFRVGFASMLKQDLGFTEVLETGSLDEAIEMLAHHPEVRLATIDLAMPGVDSAASVQAVREVFPDVLVAVVTASLLRRDILLALAAGAHGYVPKTLGIQQISSALGQIMQGAIYLPPEIARAPNAGDAQRLREVGSPDQMATNLTPRQREVLNEIAEGKSNKEIARALDLTESTVKVHVHALFQVLGVSNRTSAAAALARLNAAHHRPLAPARPGEDRAGDEPLLPRSGT